MSDVEDYWEEPWGGFGRCLVDPAHWDLEPTSTFTFLWLILIIGGSDFETNDFAIDFVVGGQDADLFLKHFYLALPLSQVKFCVSYYSNLDQKWMKLPLEE